MPRRILQDRSRKMRAHHEIAPTLSTMLVPWRLTALMLRAEHDPALSGRIVLVLFLLAALFGTVSFILGIIAPAFLWMCSAAVAAYCAGLVVLSFVILNALSMRR